MNTDMILVTGATGFIGSHLVRRLVGLGHSVSILTRPGADTHRIADLLSQIKQYEATLTEPESVAKVFQKVKPTGVMHLAASNIMSGKTASDTEVYSVNFIGTKNLMDAAATSGVDFFINTGTFLEYGLQNRPVKENDRCDPTELYSVSKLAATVYGQAVARQKQLSVITLRLFTPYGPGIQQGRLIRVVIENALKGTPINLSSPTVTRDFVFVEDVVSLYIEAMQKSKNLAGEIFNVASGATTPFGELLPLVLTATHSGSTVNWGAFQLSPYDAVRWEADMTKTFQTFTWRPTVSLVDGITHTAAWLQKTLA